jgi:predicted small lipoprotein YifL
MRRLAIAIVIAVTVVACGEDGPAKFAELYDTAPPPAVPASTDPVPASGPIPDGTYWALATSPELEFRVTQATFGDDIAEVSEPSRDLTSPPSAIVTATVVDQGTQVNYAVTGDELALLIDGQPANTPDGVSFTYTPFPFLITVRDGAVVTALQIWMP